MVAYSVGEKLEPCSDQSSDSPPTSGNQEKGEQGEGVAQQQGPGQPVIIERRQTNEQDCYEVVTAWVHPR